jgi:hypothetical protein
MQSSTGTPTTTEPKIATILPVLLFEERLNDRQTNTEMPTKARKQTIARMGRSNGMSMAVADDS